LSILRRKDPGSPRTFSALEVVVVVVVAAAVVDMP